MTNKQKEAKQKAAKQTRATKLEKIKAFAFYMGYSKLWPYDNLTTWKEAIARFK